MKRLKRVFTILTGALLLAMALTACGGGKSSGDITVDAAKLAEQLQSETVTTDTLAATPEGQIASIYFFDTAKIENAAAYTSSGATACEVAVVECSDSSYTGEVEKLFKNRAEHQAELYKSYNAGEVSKLENAIIKSAGKYVVFCVCDDTGKASQILKDSGF